MKEFVFIPKYNLAPVVLLTVFLVAFGGGMAWGGALSRSLFLSISGGAIVLLTPITLITLRLKSITFRENEVVVERPLSRNHVLSYKNFTGMDKEFIRFGNKGIPLTFLKNVDELYSIFSRLMDEHRITYSQDVIVDWILILKILRNAWIVSWTITITSLIFSAYRSDVNLNIILVIGLTSFVVVSIGNYYFFKRREEINRKRNTL